MIIANKEKCIRCGGCVGTCPQLALTLTEHGIACDRKRCNKCRICINFCPVGALSLK